VLPSTAPAAVVALACTLLVLLVLLGLAVLTGTGQRRRGGPWPAALAAGLLFPLAWLVWYVRDEQPFRRRRA